MLQILKMVEKIEMSKQPTTKSKNAGLGAAIATKLMIDSWFGLGIILAVGVVERFELLHWGPYKQ